MHTISHPRRALVTGGAGFIGSHLAERLIADGWHVTVVDAFTPFYNAADKAANLAALASEPRFDLVTADLVDAPLELLLSERPAVVHLAAHAGVRSSFGDGFDQYVHDNILATQRLFEASRAAGCARVVYASSSSVYGDASAYPCGETETPTNPRSPYGVTKRACEELAAVYRHLGLETVGLRYFTVYGPRQRPDMAIRRLCEAIEGGPAFRLYGDGNQSRDFTFVADAVDATVRAMSTASVPPVLNVGGGQEATMREVIGMLESLAGRALPIELGRPQAGDVRRTGADNTRARDSLGWRPAVSLPDGLEAALAWTRRRPVAAMRS